MSDGQKFDWAAVDRLRDAALTSEAAAMDDPRLNGRLKQWVDSLGKQGKPAPSPTEKPKAEFPRKAMRRDWEPTV